MVKFADTDQQRDTYEFKLLDFNYYNSATSFPVEEPDEDADYVPSQFRIQIFGIAEDGRTCSIVAENFYPFFYTQVPDNWNVQKKEEFIRHIKDNIKPFYHATIRVDGCKIIKRRKLYGFDAGREYKFLRLEFTNMTGFNQVKNLWYTSYEMGHVLLKSGYQYRGVRLPLYEANIPAILRFFHITEISPSGWIQVPTKKATYRGSRGFTTCDYEFCIDYRNLVALPNKETVVPYKIMSFDIEASSSHGDFPVPKKTYKKLAQNIFEYYERTTTTNTNTKKSANTHTPTQYRNDLLAILLHAYNVVPTAQFNGLIERVYPKTTVTENLIKSWVAQLVSISGANAHKIMTATPNTITRLFERFELNQQMMDATAAAAAADVEADDEADADDDAEADADDDTMVEIEASASSDDGDDDVPLLPTICVTEEVIYDDKINHQIGDSAILDILSDIGGSGAAKDRVERINQLDKFFTVVLPELEGDQVTFIGSTLMHYGESDPYLNHCIVLGNCAPMPDVAHSVLETYKTEAEVLLAWTAFVQRENPDIVLGYNIFGFDYEFMFYRAEETGVLADFLRLSRNQGEICTGPAPRRGTAANKHSTGQYYLSETSLRIASGEYLMNYINMTGRLQIDLYMHYRRNFNLSSYKLDSVASDNISDRIIALTHYAAADDSMSTIKTKNMTGLTVGSYIHIREEQFTAEYLNDGEKFPVTAIDRTRGEFTIRGHPDPDFATKTVKWGMAKDDVSPQDIFRMTNGTLADRAIIAKYCVQDCNLVHYLANKIDIITDYVEMANICAVPINFLIMRGQGIKLFSLLAQFCRENQTLIPVIEKTNDGGYEGAIVLAPKCDLYLDKPVAVNDYNSLYPSSMISENISHDSKVWTREYDLGGNLVRETGEKDADGTFTYDDLLEYDYVDVTYDTYKFVKDPKRPAGKAKKVKCGYKVCRFAQFPDGSRAIVPAILDKLLKARKATRALQAELKKTAPSDYRLQIWEKRQINYKLCANSVYGQCGATTSSFYEKDIAASTTAIGRLNITYAKRLLEECYGNAICYYQREKDMSNLIFGAMHSFNPNVDLVSKSHELVCNITCGTLPPIVDTVYGAVITNAEYIYGDTDSIFYTFNLKRLDGTPIVGREALEITIELAKEVGHLASSYLKLPHNWEYEKTLWPFCLLSKKRYFGILYEDNIAHHEFKQMGIVLKRRDNAPIVKDVYGGIIDIILKEQDILKAADFLQTSLRAIAEEHVPMSKLVITKQLRSGYAKPQQIAHKVLADRMGDRDAGNRPKAGDRIDYAFIEVAAPTKRGEKILQGNRIETPAFIVANGLKIDYTYYITNQILEPVQQVFALVLERMWELQRKGPQIKMFRREVENIRNKARQDGWTTERLDKNLKKLRKDKVVGMLFEPCLRTLEQKKLGVQSIAAFFGTRK